ncbi:MAG TPA: hypothetical protein VFQ94_00230 [Gallionella sp.]|nr:hypothetical protein [Gallionella sp.]
MQTINCGFQDEGLCQEVAPVIGNSRWHCRNQIWKPMNGRKVDATAVAICGDLLLEASGAEYLLLLRKRGLIRHPRESGDPDA